MSDSPGRVRTATSSDRAAVIDTTVAAFQHDPAFRWFFPTAESWARNVRLFVGALFDSRVGHDATWVTAGAEAVAMWATPTADGVRADLGNLDDPSRQRLSEYNAATEGGLPDGPFWYLGILATHPAHRGRALGRAAMQPGLRTAAESGLPAYLETTNADNVTLYERAGWERTGETTIDTLTIWVLRYSGSH